MEQEIKIIKEFNVEGVKTKKVVENSIGDIILIGLAKGERIKEHVSNTDATIYIVEGEIEFSINGKEINLKEKEFFTFLKNVPHALKGIENSKILLIK